MRQRLISTGLISVLVTFIGIISLAQNKMRTVDELISKKDPGWPLVQEWISAAINKVEVLPCDPVKAREALYQTQVTTRSPMGAIIHSTGGLLIDEGWIRILGSGHTRLNRTLPEWNKGKSFQQYDERPSFLLVADDAMGGFFAINGGAFGADAGKLYYLSPDNLVWEPMELTYTEFLHFCFNGDLNKFYQGYRWTDWQKEVADLPGHKSYNFFPPLWTEEGKDIDKTSRNPIDVEELYSLILEIKKQLGDKLMK